MIVGPLGLRQDHAAQRHRLCGYVGEKTGKALNYAGYGVMGASMPLFVLAGLWR